MSENITDYIVEHVTSNTPLALKYIHMGSVLVLPDLLLPRCIPYGKLGDVMPYLGRRAIENKSVLGGPDGASAERRRVGKEIKRRMLFW